MRHAASIFLLLTTSAIAQATHSPSFNCNNAQTPREHAICNNPALSSLDIQVAAAYRSLQSSLSQPSADLVQADQREWLLWLDTVCPEHSRLPSRNITTCLRNSYSDRLHQLQPLRRSATDPFIFTRAHFVVIPADASDGPPNGDDPGFGTGIFSWPQIDRPNPHQTLWNQAIYAAAIKSADDSPEKQPAESIDSTVDPAGTIDIACAVEASNPHLIVTRITEMSFGYGAAHPLTGSIFFTWSLDANRQLEPSDVFRDGTPWQTALVAPTIATLKSSPGLAGYLAPDDDLRKSVADALDHPTAWQVSRSGLTIHFGQYDVGAYVIGMPEVHFAWKELRPLLSPTLKINNLPPLSPETH